MDIEEFDDSFFESLNKFKQSDVFQKQIRNFHESIFGRYETRLIREEQRIGEHRSKKYFHEKRYDMEVFYSGDVFVVTSNLATERDLLNLSFTDVSKKSGIYIIFNKDNFYVGQTSHGFIYRLKKHYTSTSDKKIPLFDRGRVIFFGRVGRDKRENGALGKDQLDYIEKELIGLLNTGTRTKQNSNFGNKSYISFENKISADHLIDEMQRVVSMSKRNVFIEEEIIETKKIGGIDFHPVFEANSKFMKEFSFNVDKDSYLGRLLKEREKVRDQLIFVEHEWAGNIIAHIPKVKDHIPNTFYLPSRDGDWPEDEDSFLEFEIGLVDEFLLRAKIAEKLNEVGFTDFSTNSCSTELNKILKSAMNEKLLEELNTLKYEDLKIISSGDGIKVALGSLEIDISIGKEGVLVLEIDQTTQHHFNLKDCLISIKKTLNRSST